MPGTPNWPNCKKVAVGRPSEPVVVRLVKQYNGISIGLNRLAAAVPTECPRQGRGATGTGNATGNGPADDIDPIDVETFVASLPDRLRRRITETPTAASDGSDDLFFVVCALIERGRSDRCIAW
jgi:hypothetical protein